ncbi:MAG: sulfatase-like hydrolase/transferase [Pirellulales bacterium]|nr:sulfatase-like hydrolase/transferase [Pirellulales bacterium]
MRNLTRIFLGVCLGCAAHWTGAAAWAVAPPPNVIYINVDDAGLGDFTSFTPSSPVSTPNLDALAAGGVKFTHAYSSAPVCAPARSSLMTGYHMGHAPVRSNSGGTHIFRSTYTLAEMMKDAGYATAGFGKWGIGNTGTTGAPEYQGWDRFFGYNHQVHAHNHYTNHLFDNGKRVEIPENVGAGSGLVNPSHTHTFNLYAQEMQNFIQQKAVAEERFFAYGAWTPPHLDNEIPSNEPLYQQYANVSGWNQHTKIQATFISMIDREVGRIMEIVNDPNGDSDNSDSIAGNTLVMFVSDNGGSTPNALVYDRNPGLRGQKGTLFEGGLRVPMIASWAGEITPGTTSPVHTYFADIMPTLGELAGVSNLVPADTDGISLAPTLTEQGTQQTHNYLYFEDEPYNFGSGTLSGNLRQAVRMGDWKAVKNGTTASIQLFDLANDAAETTNVAGANPAVVAQMAAIMTAEHDDARIQFDTGGTSGGVTPFGIRTHVRTVSPLDNSSFENPQLLPTDPNQGAFLNNGAVGWSGGFIQNVPNTEAANGTPVFLDPTPDGNQVGGANSGGSLTQPLRDALGDDWEFYIDDLEQQWTIDLDIGRRVDSQANPTTLRIELVGDSGVAYLSTTYDTSQLTPGEWSRESLAFTLTTDTPARSNMTSDLGGGLSLVLTNAGGGQVMVDDVSLSVVNDWLPGDFTGNLALELADWNILISNFLTDTSSMSFSQAYALGDIDYSGRVGLEDFIAFRRSWELLYGTAALSQLTTTIPEPGSLALAAFVLALGVAMRRQRQATTKMLLISVITFAFAQGQAFAVLVNHYTFDAGNGNDSVGTNHLQQLKDGTGPDLTFQNGFVSNSGSSLENGAWLEAGTALNYGSNDDWSIAFFVRDTNFADNAAFDGIFSSDTSGASTTWQIDIRNAGTRDIGSPGNTGTFANIGDGLFHHVAVVHDAAATRPVLYYDGQLLSNVTWSAARDQLTKPVLFRNRNNSATQFFTGDLDDVRIYDHPLTINEVLGLIPGLADELLTLRVNTTNGAVSLQGSVESQDVVAYQIEPNDQGQTLELSGWTSMQASGFDGGGWQEAGGASAAAVGEARLLGASNFTQSTLVPLGTLYDEAADLRNLDFTYVRSDLTEVIGLVDYFAGFASDFDADGDVDEGDLLLWRNHYGQNGGADADGDGNSTGSDFLIWQREFGSSVATTSAATVAVPEPGNVLLIISAATLLVRRWPNIVIAS